MKGLCVWKVFTVSFCARWVSLTCKSTQCLAIAKDDVHTQLFTRTNAYHLFCYSSLCFFAASQQNLRYVSEFTFSFFFFFKLYFYFLHLYRVQWDFSHGKFGLLPRGKPAATESRYPTYGACRVFSIAHGGVRTPWESLHWKLTLGEKSLCRTGESNLRATACRFDALPPELHPTP